MITDEIRNELFENADEDYKKFQSKLIPNIQPENIIGVRTPTVKRLAKKYAQREDIEAFLNTLPHRYYDENNLHGFIIAECMDYKKAVQHINNFLPYVDNWATCDLLRPKVFSKNREMLKKDIDIWLTSEKTYTVRFGIEMLMCHFLDDYFDRQSLKKVANIKSDEYYINMMQAWFFATALSKQWENTVPYIENRKLDSITHRKAIQKAVESYRITPSQKEYLKTLK